MKNFKIKIFLMTLIAMTIISCGGDDDTTEDNPESALLTIGTCGQFFNNAGLTSLCGVQSSASQGIGTGLVCTYVIWPNNETSQELYAATLWESESIEASVELYNLLGNDFFPGEMLTPLSGLGEEAVYAEDQENQDFRILFRFNNITAAVGTDEMLFELGCDNPQGKLRELGNLIIETAQ